ncbi:MAG: hypothetical protein ACQERD_01865 [Campylobacterota bacterium]
MNELPLVLSDETKCNSKDIEALFEIFKNDFIDGVAILNLDKADYTITVKPDICCDCPYQKDKKPERFWHIITKKEFDTKKKNNPCPEDKEKNRAYDVARAKRIHWIKQTIENIDEEHIKYFCEGGKQLTHFLWDTKRFYIVLIKHLGKSKNLLVTAFPVHQNKYRDYKARLKKYKKKMKL